MSENEKNELQECIWNLRAEQSNVDPDTRQAIQERIKELYAILDAL